MKNATPENRQMLSQSITPKLVRPLSQGAVVPRRNAPNGKYTLRRNMKHGNEELQKLT